jgi:hypothetical protein
MLKRLTFFILLGTWCATSALAQEKQKKAFRPDIPGNFLIDFGFNTTQNTPTNFVQGTWGSRTLNLYYHYPIRLFNSKFSFNPGAGFSFERFKLTNNYTLSNVPVNGQYTLVEAPTVLQTNGVPPSISKSMLVANYFDLMPIEIRFNNNPSDPGRGVNVAVGARVGFLFESHTKINYSLEGQSATFKDKQSHGLNSIRYGVYSRVGVGNFNFFWFYNLSPYFASGKGPYISGTDQSSTTMNTMTFGISLNGF